MISTLVKSVLEAKLRRTSATERRSAFLMVCKCSSSNGNNKSLVNFNANLFPQGRLTNILF